MVSLCMKCRLHVHILCESLIIIVQNICEIKGTFKQIFICKPVEHLKLCEHMYFHKFIGCGSMAKPLLAIYARLFSAV